MFGAIRLGLRLGIGSREVGILARAGLDQDAVLGGDRRDAGQAFATTIEREMFGCADAAQEKDRTAAVIFVQALGESERGERGSERFEHRRNDEQVMRHHVADAGRTQGAEGGVSAAQNRSSRR